MRWYKIGNFPTLTLEQARTESRARLQDVSRKIDLTKVKHDAKTAITVSELCDWYISTNWLFPGYHQNI